MNTLPHKKHPCISCPFRQDSLKGWLGKERALEISEAQSFTCHKTKKELQCAGHMLLLEEANAYVRVAQRMSLPLGLKGRDLIFKTIKDFINHHKN